MAYCRYLCPRREKDSLRYKLHLLWALSLPERRYYDNNNICCSLRYYGRVCGLNLFEYDATTAAVLVRWRTTDRRCFRQSLLSRRAFLLRVSKRAAVVLDQCGKLADLAARIRGSHFLPTSPARTVSPDSFLQRVRSYSGLRIPHDHPRDPRPPFLMGSFLACPSNCRGQQPRKPDSGPIVTLASSVRRL